MSGKEDWGEGGGETAERGMCCLIDQRRRCMRPAGNAVYGNRNIQRIVQQRKLKLERDDTCSHRYICDHHKQKIMSGRTVKRRRFSDEESSPEPSEKRGKTELTIFNQLSMSVLRKYKKNYRLPARLGMSKANLAEVVTKHFRTLKVNEKEVLTYFIYSLKRRREQDGGGDPSPLQHSKYRLSDSL